MINQTLTGESHPVKKTCEPFPDSGYSRIEFPNLIFAGTNVVSGTGRAVVIATGMKTEFGKVADLTQTIKEEQSPLQKEMVYVTRVVTIVAVSVGVIFFLLLLNLTMVSLAESFIFALGMIVAFVPEGLLPTVTLALARGSQRMAERNALIKRLSAVETLGCTSVICTDKTGTLTQNEMTVKEIWVSDQYLSVSGSGYDPTGEILQSDGSVPEDIRSALAEILITSILCTNARLLPPDAGSSQWSVLGDPTEAALLVAAKKGGINLEQENRQMPRVREFPFDSRRKLMSTINLTGNHEILCLKGAPREVLSLCSAMRRGEEKSPLTEELRAEVIEVNDSFAQKGLRVIAVAVRDLPDERRIDTPEEAEQDLTFLGLIAMMDPPRPEVADAVARCKNASIRIIMITGDYGLTAKSIARRIGIIQSDTPRIVNGSELDAMTDDELVAVLGEEVLFARVAPEHKLRVVAHTQGYGTDRCSHRRRGK